MPMDIVADITPVTSGLAPFSLKDAPALIERVFPAQKVGIEAQKERKAVAGQTLTALGAYWKGRKPLVLIRACVLASLLPATDDPEGDLNAFEALMRMDLEGLQRRLPDVTPSMIVSSKAVSNDDWTPHISFGSQDQEFENGDFDQSLLLSNKARWRKLELGHLTSRVARLEERERVDAEREKLKKKVLLSLSFTEQVSICERVEKIELMRQNDDPLYAGVFSQVNRHLGTTALNLQELVLQLGIARFGHRPTVGDPFCGGGSVPFEAVRTGCDTVASDLNPIAAMLTWGALNIVGASQETRDSYRQEQERVEHEVSATIRKLGIEHDEAGNQAKAYLYCLEALDPQTGWLVPAIPSQVISETRRCVVRLVPDYAQKRFDLQLAEGVSAEEMEVAARGTVRDGALIYYLSQIEGGEEQEFKALVARLRGDGEGHRQPDGTVLNLLRWWGQEDVAPRLHKWNPDADPVVAGSARGAWLGGDVWQERLYAIQWTRRRETPEGKGKQRSETFFAAPTERDLETEAGIRRLVEANLAQWQAEGAVSSMEIETGKETEGPIRTNGWKFWHHLFVPRAILTAQVIWRAWGRTPTGALALARYLDNSSKGCRWAVAQSGGDGGAKSTFDNQSLKTIFNWALRSSVATPWPMRNQPSLAFCNVAEISTGPVSGLKTSADIFITDPPYADAVHYHEITEFFIAWLRKNPPTPFDQWTWDSRRPFAIQGKGEKFRSDMVDAFRAMANHMPDNGLQVCMFTHQDAGVWADMAGIVWGAGLRVTAAWYVSTETASELKKGGYVQGTVLLVLRKRQGDERAYKDELVLEVRGAVQRQVDLLTGLNQHAKALQRDENPFSDADLQMAGYAAALEVLTGYTHIEGVDMTREALRPRVKGQKGVVEEMIALAVQTATELMRPEGIDETMWERLAPTERFWLKMSEAEAQRPAGQPQGKLDDYQNFAKAYRADGWVDLMADQTPNRARLKGAAEFKRALMAGHPFAGGLVRPVLYAVNELRAAAEKEEDPSTSGERALAGLRDNLGSWAQQRQRAMVVADWLGRTFERHRSAEASAARTLSALIRTERLG